MKNKIKIGIVLVVTAIIIYGIYWVYITLNSLKIGEINIFNGEQQLYQGENQIFQAITASTTKK